MRPLRGHHGTDRRSGEYFESVVQARPDSRQSAQVDQDRRAEEPSVSAAGQRQDSQRPERRA